MKKIKAAVLGATGIVGQRLVGILAAHPWFEIEALCASAESAGLRYAEAVRGRWRAPGDIPPGAAGMVVQPCLPDIGVRLAFSALEAGPAGPIEESFARAGCLVCTNARDHRMSADVPLLVPEVNADHIESVRRQGYGSGGIIANPNCATAGLVLALAPLHKAFGVRRVFVATMQALSGAGYPGVPALDAVGNIIPLIPGEEEKIESEPLKILGDGTRPAGFRVSASCHRAASLEGHLLSAAVEFERGASCQAVAAAMSSFAPLRDLGLPGAPAFPLFVHPDGDRPQPCRDAGRGDGMTVTVGRIRPDRLFDCRFTALVNNLVRGAAGAAVLNAELAVRRGYLS
ncbi:MAG: aspartate-semialdehyde dehydrogenase [Acidobacteriota bacterium]